MSEVSLAACFKTVWVASAAPITLWIAGAIYYDVSGGAKWGEVLAAGWVVGVIVMFAVWRPFWQPLTVLIGVTALFVGWWLQQKPSHDRDWAPEVAALPRVVREGDLMTIENVRNFDYASPEEFTPRYDTRRFHLANLKAADIIFFNWGSTWMSHPVLVFDFGPDGRVCVSIEVRYRRGQGYSVLRSLYRQQELIFLVADERDVILRRTKYGPPQTAHLYWFNATLDELRAVFVDYVESINRLYETPSWYNGLCANCTTSFYRLPHSRPRWDWRVIANGRLDRALYEDGRLDRTLPFEELHRLALVNEVANSAPEDGFSDYIRCKLEGRNREP
jgi:hypothetical protein